MLKQFLHFLYKVVFSTPHFFITLLKSDWVALLTLTDICRDTVIQKIFQLQMECQNPPYLFAGLSNSGCFVTGLGVSFKSLSEFRPLNVVNFPAGVVNKRFTRRRDHKELSLSLTVYHSQLRSYVKVSK